MYMVLCIVHVLPCLSGLRLPLFVHTIIHVHVHIRTFIVFCVGGSKAPPVLYSSYRTHNVWTGAVTSYSV